MGNIMIEIADKHGSKHTQADKVVSPVDICLPSRNGPASTRELQAVVCGWKDIKNFRVFEHPPGMAGKNLN